MFLTYFWNNSGEQNFFIFYESFSIRIYRPKIILKKIGNEYNVYVPANGSVTLEYLPDGKYYLTFSSATVQDNQDITHSATIDYWRGYVDDMNNFSWARPLRDNNFGLVSGTPSNISDKTLYPFGNGDKKNEVTYGTSTIKNTPNSYSVYEYNGNTKKYANKCPIHGTILTNGKCTNSDCTYSIYQYYSNGSNIVDDKLPYNVYSQYKGTEKNTLK